MHVSYICAVAEPSCAAGAEDGDPSDNVPWNAMLTVYARAKNKDGGFALWQRMVGNGVTIDDFTERLLADLFGDHPQMAATMLKEARRRRLQQSVSVPGVEARAWGLAVCCAVWELADRRQHAGEAKAATAPGVQPRRRLDNVLCCMRL